MMWKKTNSEYHNKCQNCYGHFLSCHDLEINLGKNFSILFDFMTLIKIKIESKQVPASYFHIILILMFLLHNNSTDVFFSFFFWFVYITTFVRAII